MEHQFAIQFLLLLTQYFRQAYNFKPYDIDQGLKAPQDQANSSISSQDQANSLISLDFQFTQIPHAF